MKCLLAKTENKMIFDANIVTDLDLIQLSRVFLSENEYNEEQLINWLYTYITYDKHEISRRSTILAHLALNPQNLEYMKQINEKCKLMEFSLKEAGSTKHPLLIYTHMLNALEAYVSTVEMLLNIFSGADNDVINDLYREVYTESVSER